MERQIIQLSRQGVSHFCIVTEENSGQNVKDLTKKIRLDTVHIEKATSIQGHIEKKPSLLNQVCLFTQSNNLIDERIFSEIIKRPEETVLAGIYDNAETPQVIALKAPVKLHIDCKSFGEFATHLNDNTPSFNIKTLPTYIANRRREIPIVAAVVNHNSNLSEWTGKILDTAQKGTLDWPARWIHPYFENALVKILLPTFVSPNMVTLLTGVLGFWVTYLFATGQMITATLGAMFVGILDGVDGKLARTKMLESNVGELEHLLDKAVEYSWYFAMAYYFVETNGNAVWGLAVIAVFFAWAETVQGEFYRRLTGVQLDDAGTFEKYWRLIGGRRNTFIWSFLPFAAYGFAYEGLWMIALYSLVTFFVAQFRFIVRFKNYASQNGAQIAKNWSETAYF